MVSFIDQKFCRLCCRLLQLNKQSNLKSAVIKNRNLGVDMDRKIHAELDNSYDNGRYSWNQTWAIKILAPR